MIIFGQSKRRFSCPRGLPSECSCPTASVARPVSRTRFANGYPALRRVTGWLLLLAATAGASAQLGAQSVSVAWDACSDPFVAGYVVTWGTASGDYTNAEDTGVQTAITISDLSIGATYYFAVASYDAAGDESPYSTEISYTVPGAVSLSFSGLTQTYNGAPEAVTVTTSPPNLPVTVAYNGSANPPVNAGAYTVVATVADPNYPGSATNTLLISPASATVALGGLAATYNGSAQLATVTTSPAGLATTITYNGSAAAPVNAGSYVVLATVINSNYTGSATNTLVISPASATVTLGGLAATYNGSAQPATVTTSPAGLTTTITYNGSATPPVNAGAYLVLATISNPNYSGSANNTLIISPPIYTVTTQVYPADEGSATGGGSYVAGSTVALTAAAHRGYIFTNWTLNGAVQSFSSNYSFTVATNLILVANFTTNAIPIALLNGSFESPAVADGGAGGLPGGWLAANQDPCGVYNPGTGVYSNIVNNILPSPADGSQVLFIVGGNYVAQFLTNTLRAGHTYTLSGAIGNRGDGYGILSSDQDFVDLVAGNTIVAENYRLPLPAPGTFLPWTISYTAPASGFPTGPLQIRLGMNGAGQVNYDNITLTVTRLSSTTLSPSATALASSQNPVPAWATVAFTATVIGSNGTPTGTVVFFDGTNNLGSGILDSSGVASLSISALSAGASPHSITAAYSGDGVFAASTSSVLSQNITNAAAIATASGTTITLDNDNFAIPVGAQGTVEGMPPGWLAANKDPYGVYNPAPGVYSNEVNDILPAPVGSSQLLYITGGNYVAQFLTNTLQAGQTYILSGAIGNRGDGYGLLSSDQDYVELVAGDTVVAQNTNLTHPAPGTFLAWIISYTAPATGFPAGSLQIRLGQEGSGEVDFGNITLTMTSPAVTTDATAESLSAVTDATLSSATASADSSIVNSLAVAAAGTYRGLFYVTGDAAEESSGGITTTITGTGAFSATLQLGAQSFPFSGSLSPAGAALNSITPTNANPLTVQLQLDLTNGPLTGTVSDGTWTATLLAEAAIYSNTNPAPQAGNYALLLPSADNASAQAGGNGSGTVAVSDSGNVTFIGILGDGTPVTSTGTVCSQGLWPFYLPLSGGNSCILGWLSFTNTASGYVLAPTASGIALLPSAQ